MKEYVVDLTSVTSWPQFIAAFNEGFMRPVSGEWNGNLDAFHDYLSSVGDEPASETYRLVLRGWKSLEGEINEHQTWDGRLVLDVISEILGDNPHVKVVLD
jgi:hypothetical protein